MHLAQTVKLTNNINDTALIFEGGGMRASYTAGFLNVLLENQIYFDYTSGISAGSSHCVNYISRDIERSKKSFVELVKDPQFGGWGSFLKGEGYFRSEYIYEKTPLPGEALPFDFETFHLNPARLRIGAFDCISGTMDYFKKEDIKDMQCLMKIVRASSSMPIFMPPTSMNGKLYIDGGLGGGIPLEIAKRDGFHRFFVVLSRPKGYRKSPAALQGLFRAYYRRYPVVAEAMSKRHIIYNRTLDELCELEAEGRALLVYPDHMPVSSRETDYSKLKDSYQRGYQQGRRDLSQWKAFLEIY